MSKKIASGAKKLVLEVTCGKGAFMEDREKAKKLSLIMKKLGELAGIETVCIITNMDQPIGKMIGNSLEIEEAKNVLNGNMEEDIKEIVLEIVAYMLKLAGKGENIEENKKKGLESIQTGSAYNKFLELIKKQNGDTEYLNNIPKAKYIVTVEADKSGYVNQLNARICRRSFFIYWSSEE